MRCELPGRVEQQDPERVERDVEGLEQGGAEQDEDEPQEQRERDSPREHARLHLPLGHGEVRQDHREDEDVVERQRALEQVAGEVLLACLGTLPGPEPEAEQQRDRDPPDRPQRVLPHAGDVAARVNHEVERRHDQDHDAKPCPPRNRDVEVQAVNCSEHGILLQRSWEKVSSARCGPMAPGLSAVLTNATRRDYFPSGIEDSGGGATEITGSERIWRCSRSAGPAPRACARTACNSAADR